MCNEQVHEVIERFLCDLLVGAATPEVVEVLMPARGSDPYGDLASTVETGEDFVARTRTANQVGTADPPRLHVAPFAWDVEVLIQERARESLERYVGRCGLHSLVGLEVMTGLASAVFVG